MRARELPECVVRALWDTDARPLSLETHGSFLIGRILRREAGDAALREWIVATRARRLSRPQIRFWQLLLDLPEEEVESWLRAPERQVWDRRCG